MSDSKKRKTVNYRRCVADAPAGSAEKFDLQAHLTSAKNKLSRPWVRPLGDGSISQFLAHLVEKQKCLCGTLVLWEDNRLIPLVDAETDGSTWEDSIQPVDGKGKKRKLQQQAIYFAVRENHVAIIQTKEFSIVHLLDFFTWFIQSQAELAEGWLFTLQNLPSQSALEKLKDHTIKGIKIGKTAFSVIKTPVSNPENPNAKTKYINKIETDPTVMGWLRKLTKDDALLDELEKSNDPGKIYVGLEIRYQSRGEKDAKKVMQSLAATLGGQSDLSPEIELSGKSKIKGDELTISDHVDVQCPGGNVSKDDAMTRLAEWLNASIKSGKVLV